MGSMISEKKEIEKFEISLDKCCVNTETEWNTISGRPLDECLQICTSNDDCMLF